MVKPSVYFSKCRWAFSIEVVYGRLIPFNLSLFTKVSIFTRFKLFLFNFPS
jgi:hypothetical protein